MPSTSKPLTVNSQPVGFFRHSVVKLGSSKGAPRVFLEGRWLIDGGFQPACLIDAEFKPGIVTLRLSRDGKRCVSSKKKGRVPVIDINSPLLTSSFGNSPTLQIKLAQGLIEISRSLTESKKRTRARNNEEGSFFSGGGLLSEAARQAGFEPSLAIEIEPSYAEIYRRNHPGAQLFNSCISQVPLTDISHHPELLTIGIPCDPYSIKRTLDRKTAAKRDRSLPPEAHELGDMAGYAIIHIHHLNPASIVVEQVPNFLGSAAGWMLMRFLERSGYYTDARVLDPCDYGSIAGRKRAVILASSDGPVRWPAKRPATTTLGQLFDPAHKVASEWFDRDGSVTGRSKDWLFKHWEAQTSKGNNFEPPKLTANTVRVPAITKRYLAGQGDQPVVSHPTLPGVYRWLTLDEIRRIHQVPEHYDLGDTKTVAGEIVGQGVVIGLFKEVIEVLTGRSTNYELNTPVHDNQKSKTQNPFPENQIIHQPRQAPLFY